MHPVVLGVQALKTFVANMRCLAFDLWHGVHTRGDVDLPRLTIDSPNLDHGTGYQPTHPKLIRKILLSLPIDHSQYTFLDYGSGKGRVLLIAAGYPFKQIVGIEFAKELHEIAVRNIARFRGRRLCPSIESVHADALAFDLPLDPLAIFMFNPFRPPVLKPLMEKISRSLLASPRDAWLIYTSPYHAHLVSHPFAVVEGRVYQSVNIYHASPSLALAPPAP
jgi:SAM-dependent methyltransferase